MNCEICGKIIPLTPGEPICGDCEAALKRNGYEKRETSSIVWRFGFQHCKVCGQMLPEGDAVNFCLHCGRSVK